MIQNLRKSATRIAGMLGIGRITSQKDSGVVQEVQYQTPLEVASAPRFSDFGFSSGLPAGADRSSPVVIASNHQGYRHTGLKPGETVVYNQWGLNIHLTESGIFIDAKGKDVEISNAANITATATEQVKLVTPRLLVTGDIIDNCEKNDKTLKALRDAYNGHDHDVKNVQSGDSIKTSEKTESQV